MPAKLPCECACESESESLYECAFACVGAVFVCIHVRVLELMLVPVRMFACECVHACVEAGSTVSNLP